MEYTVKLDGSLAPNEAGNGNKKQDQGPGGPGVAGGAPQAPSAVPGGMGPETPGGLVPEAPGGSMHPRRTTRRLAHASRGVGLAALAVGVLAPTACGSLLARDLEPRPLTPLQRGEYQGPPPQITGEPGAASDVVERLARVFYIRVINRRFNSLSTYHDPALR